MKTKSAPERGRIKPAKIAGQARAARAAGVSFPIVGIGASAGGLEAWEQFLERVPVGSGMAFVIVQHPDPTHTTPLLHRDICGSCPESKAVASKHTGGREMPIDALQTRTSRMNPKTADSRPGVAGLREICG
jgi:hypothetical protein